MKYSLPNTTVGMEEQGTLPVFGPVLMSLLAGLSTTLGAGVVFLMPGKRVPPTHMAFALAMAAGVMLSVTLLEFWLPALDGTKNITPVIAYSLLGAMAFYLLTYLVPEPELAEGIRHSHSGSTYQSTPQGNHNGVPNDAVGRAIEASCCDDQEMMESSMPPASRKDGAVGDESDKEYLRHWRLVIVLMVSLTAHNFPEGFAVAISALHSTNMGFVVMIAIAMHNIPEGIAIAVPVYAATGSHWRAFWMSFLSGMAEPIGALTAIAAVHLIGGRISESVLENLLCVVGGMMSAVALKELLPEAMRQDRPIGCWTGFFAGMLLMWMTIKLGA